MTPYPDADPQAAAVVAQIASFLAHDEQILAVAVQDKLGVTLAPAGVIATTKRLLIHKAHALGKADIVEFAWREVRNIDLAEGLLHTTLTLARTLTGTQLAPHTLLNRV